MVYLCGEGRDLAEDADLRDAVLSYNRSQAYLAQVLRWKGTFDAAELDQLSSLPAFSSWAISTPVEPAVVDVAEAVRPVPLTQSAGATPKGRPALPPRPVDRRPVARPPAPPRPPRRPASPSGPAAPGTPTTTPRAAPGTTPAPTPGWSDHHPRGRPPPRSDPVDRRRRPRPTAGRPRPPRATPGRSRPARRPTRPPRRSPATIPALDTLVPAASSPPTRRCPTRPRWTRNTHPLLALGAAEGTVVLPDGSLVTVDQLCPGPPRST